MTWRVARSLDVLLEELNAAAPNRDKASDGSIGDAAHASRTSDHNPWVVLAGVGIVRARDFTHDPAGGLDCNQLAAFLARKIIDGSHPALGSGAYVIWNRRILSVDRRDEGWRPYSGSNPHDHHLHLSVATAAAGYDSTARWGWPPTKEDEVTPQDIEKIRDIVREELAPIAKRVDQIGNNSFRRDDAARERAAKRHGVELEKLDAILAELEAD